MLWNVKKEHVLSLYNTYGKITFYDCCWGSSAKLNKKNVRKYEFTFNKREYLVTILYDIVCKFKRNINRLLFC